MLKTNSKKARENIRGYIMDNCPEELSWEATKKYILDRFAVEKLRYDKRYEAGLISFREMFFEWCEGLPSALDTCYYYNRSAVDDLAGILEESDAEKSKFDERQAEEKLTWLIYRELMK